MGALRSPEPANSLYCAPLFHQLPISFLLQFIHGQICFPVSQQSHGSGTYSPLAQLENISQELYNSRISILWRFGNESMPENFFFKYHLISCCLDLPSFFCDYSTKMPGFQQEFGGSVSALISCTTVLYTICFRLMYFLSEKITVF